MAAAAAQLLGEDGRGYELARRLEACGAWREWLGDDSAHAALAQHLTSPATWDAFLYPAASPSPPPRQLLLLQLRVRALLFDNASAALLLPPRGAAPASLHSINANYLRLHGDDIFFSLWKMSRKITLNMKFGMLPEYYKSGNKYRGKDGSRVEGKSLSQEQEMLMIKKLVARYLANSGFESGSAVSVDVLSEIIIKHICKLGRNLKLLTDSYRKHFSSIELLKMFLQTVGYSNIGRLVEITKMGNRGGNYPIHQDAQVLQSQTQNANCLHAQQVILSVICTSTGVLTAALGDFSSDLYGYCMALTSVFFQTVFDSGGEIRRCGWSFLSGLDVLQQRIVTSISVLSL